MAKKPKTDEIVDLLSIVALKVKDCNLILPTADLDENMVKYLCKKLTINSFQMVLLSVILKFYAEGTRVAISEIAHHLGCMPIELIKRLDEFDALIKKGLIVRYFEGRRRMYTNDPSMATYSIQWTTFQGLFFGNLKTIRRISKLSTLEFVFAVAEILEDMNHSDLTEEETAQALENLKLCNKKLPAVAASIKYKLTWHDDLLIYALLFHYLTKDRMLTLDELLSVLNSTRNISRKKLSILEGKALIVKSGLIDLGNNELLGGHVTVMLSDKAKEEFLDEESRLKIHKTTGSKDLIAPLDIRPKQLYYPENIQSQIDVITRTLHPTTYNNVCRTLQDTGHTSGLCILFHGEPGTGKTETVYQMARMSGRQIMLFDVTKVKDMYYGQSEKNIKALFDKYRNMLQVITPEPILLFNEADAIFSKRRDVTGNIISAENTIQNIILQEMEQFKGILIATTNMTQNFDAAFDRRFLFKVNFPKPGKEVRFAIWKTTFDGYQDNFYNYLSENFQFSGGQIDVIARKVILKQIINPNKLTESEIIEICKDENPERHRRPIGFRIQNTNPALVLT